MLRPGSPTGPIYALTAPRYQADIGPVMHRLALSLVEMAAQNGRLPPGARALDLGTGTGILARCLVRRGLWVAAIDLSYPMLREARTLPIARAETQPAFVQMDANILAGLTDRSFDLAFASFGLADCEPDRVWRALRRVLRPNGWLYLQEWGPLDSRRDPRAIVDRTLAAFALPDAGAELQALRAHLAEPRPWEIRLQDVDDYTEALTEAGFAVMAVSESRPVTLRLSPDRFLTYALAWAPRRLEVEAMSPRQRAAFLRAVTSRLSRLAMPGGNLSWKPVVLQVAARRLAN